MNVIFPWGRRLMETLNSLLMTPQEAQRKDEIDWEARDKALEDDLGPWENPTFREWWKESVLDDKTSSESSVVYITLALDVSDTENLEDYEFIKVPKGTCLECRGMRSDPDYGGDVPCLGCGGTGMRRVEDDSR